MKNGFSLCFAISLFSTISWIALADEPRLLSLGFTAPSVTNTSYVASPQIGDIVYDNAINAFTG
jgi:hypothetical protein